MREDDLFEGIPESKAVEVLENGGRVREEGSEKRNTGMARGK